MTPWEELQSRKILSCFNNDEIIDENERKVGQEQSETPNTPGFTQLEEEQVVERFD